MSNGFTVDSEGNFYYSDGGLWEPYIWRKGEKSSFVDEKVYEYDAPDDQRMVAELLLNEVLFVNSKKYVWGGWNGDKQDIEPETLVLFVGCNDVFAWACSDAETVTLKELPSLYESWKNHKAWGAAKWCCLKRKQRPQKPVEQRMKDTGAWCEELEKLP